METCDELRAAIKALTERGVTQASIADRAGITRAGLCFFLSGRRKRLSADGFDRVRGAVQDVVRDDAERRKR